MCRCPVGCVTSRAVMRTRHAARPCKVARSCDMSGLVEVDVGHVVQRCWMERRSLVGSSCRIPEALSVSLDFCASRTTIPWRLTTFLLITKHLSLSRSEETCGKEKISIPYKQLFCYRTGVGPRRSTAIDWMSWIVYVDRLRSSKLQTRIG